MKTVLFCNPPPSPERGDFLQVEKRSLGMSYLRHRNLRFTPSGMSRTLSRLQLLLICSRSNQCLRFPWVFALDRSLCVYLLSELYFSCLQGRVTVIGKVTKSNFKSDCHFSEVSWLDLNSNKRYVSDTCGLTSGPKNSKEISLQKRVQNVDHQIRLLSDGQLPWGSYCFQKSQCKN
jgi:hypothetical protein